MRRVVIRLVLAGVFSGATSLAFAQQQPLNQNDFEAAYANLAKQVKDLQDEKNQLKADGSLKGLKKQESAARTSRAITAWSCAVDQVLQDSRAYDGRLGGRHGGFYMVICHSGLNEDRIQYFVLYDKSRAQAAQLEKVAVNTDPDSTTRDFMISGTLNCFSRVASFYSDVLGPTFIVRSR
jgi:hypothetical protein